MSLRDVSMFYVLGEDAAQRSFIRAWLSVGGVPPRRIYTVEPPAGKQGGIAFVRDNYKKTLGDALHRNRSKAKTRLIVAMDADDETLENRLSELKRAAAGIDENEHLDVVCALLPKRHIETWVHALGPTDPKVNEQDNYKDKTIEEVRTAAGRLARLPSAPQDPPSLVHGYGQLQRLKSP